MSVGIVNASGQAIYGVSCLKAPDGGAKAMPMNLDFSANVTYQLNLQNIGQNRQFEKIQALFIDNSNSAAPIVISFPVTGQSIQIGANKQAYLMCLCTDPANIFFTSQGGTVIPIQLLNFPVTNCVWSAT